jgi:hypothetical protein
MDPITTSHLVQDRTAALQRIADQVRQERALRSTPTPTASVAAVAMTVARARPADPQPAPSKATDCATAERAA